MSNGSQGRADMRTLLDDIGLQLGNERISNILYRRTKQTLDNGAKYRLGSGLRARPHRISAGEH